MSVRRRSEPGFARLRLAFVGLLRVLCRALQANRRSRFVAVALLVRVRRGSSRVLDFDIVSWLLAGPVLPEIAFVGTAFVGIASIEMPMRRVVLCEVLLVVGNSCLVHCVGGDRHSFLWLFAVALRRAVLGLERNLQSPMFLSEAPGSSAVQRVTVTVVWYWSSSSALPLMFRMVKDIPQTKPRSRPWKFEMTWSAVAGAAFAEHWVCLWWPR